MHAGTHDCGSVVSPRTDATTTDCKDQQRLLLVGGGAALATGTVLLAVGWHLGRPADRPEDGDPDGPELA